MSADDLYGFHNHLKRHPEHSDCVRIRAVEHVLHGAGAINPHYFAAREHARQCSAPMSGKAID